MLEFLCFYVYMYMYMYDFSQIYRETSVSSIFFGDLITGTIYQVSLQFLPCLVEQST